MTFPLKLWATSYAHFHILISLTPQHIPPPKNGTSSPLYNFLDLPHKDALSSNLIGLISSFHYCEQSDFLQKCSNFEFLPSVCCVHRLRLSTPIYSDKTSRCRGGPPWCQECDGTVRDGTGEGADTAFLPPPAAVCSQCGAAVCSQCGATV